MKAQRSNSEYKNGKIGSDSEAKEKKIEEGRKYATSANF
jgi:hypothetical protein